jgi:hypothetical protein
MLFAGASLCLLSWNHLKRKDVGAGWCFSNAFRFQRSQGRGSSSLPIRTNQFNVLEASATIWVTELCALFVP